MISEDCVVADGQHLLFSWERAVCVAVKLAVKLVLNLLGLGRKSCDF